MLGQRCSCRPSTQRHLATDRSSQTSPLKCLGDPAKSRCFAQQCCQLNRSRAFHKLQAIHPEANFVKAYNSVGSAQMVNPSYEVRPTMFICGNNPEAKKEVESINTAFGWETQDMGSAQAARAIEPLCMLWCIPGFLNNEWTHAFKLLKK